MTRDRQAELVVVEEINGMADIDAHEKNAGGKAGKEETMMGGWQLYDTELEQVAPHPKQNVRWPNDEPYGTEGIDCENN